MTARPVTRRANKHPKRPVTMSRKAAALRLATIRTQNINKQKANMGRLKFAEEVEQKTARANQELEWQRLTGAAQASAITPYSLGRLVDLKRVLGKA